MLSPLNPDGVDIPTAGRDELCFGLPGLLAGPRRTQTPRQASKSWSRAGRSSDEVSLHSDWIPEAGVAARAPVDWSRAVPVKADLPHNRAAAFNVNGPAAQRRALRSQGSATCRHGSSEWNLPREGLRA